MRNPLRPVIDRLKSIASANVTSRSAIASMESEVERTGNAFVPRAEATARTENALSDWLGNVKRKHAQALLWNVAHPSETPRLPGYREDELELVLATLLEVVGIRTAAETFMAGMSYEEGLPLAERPAVIGRLQRELDAMKAEEEMFTDEMNAAGIALAHRPDVVARRATEARRHELAEAAVAERRRLEAEVDSRRAR